MNWTQLLTQSIEETYGATSGLFELVDEGGLDWKPATGENWMSMGQLLLHTATGCGEPCKGFVTGDWGMPEGVSLADVPPEEMLPSAEKMEAVSSLDEARQALAADKQLALDMIAQAGEDDLATKMVTAPWDPRPQLLGYMLLQMVGHLGIHKAQLFYYLKLRGKPVHTGNLFGMPE